jgi:hypothetical protein
VNFTALKNCTSAGERFFRLYQKHCVAPDADTLFNLLNSIHSLNDRLNKATGDNFFESNEFIALKALRNLFHHEAELINEVRTVLAANLPSISSDLLFLCLVPSSLVVRSLDKLDPKRRVHEEPIVRATLKWYGPVVNINPCIFNFAVHVFEKLNVLSVNLSGAEYAEFEASYRFEENAGHSHFVTGDITCHVGSVETVLAVVFADVT